MPKLKVDNRARRWLLPEYVLKGVFLGLLSFVAFQDVISKEALQVAGLTVGGLLVALAFGAMYMVHEGYESRGRLGALMMFVLLESSGLVYGGTLLGLAIGAF